MVLSRTAIRSLLKKMNNEQLIFEVLNKLRSINPSINFENFEQFKEKEPREDQEIIKEQISKEQFNSEKRSFDKEEMESPLLRKKIKTNEENNTPIFESNRTRNTFETSSKDNNNLLDILLNDKFYFWKGIDEETEKKSLFNDDPEKGNSSNGVTIFNVDAFLCSSDKGNSSNEVTIFNVDDFFSS